MSPPPPPLPPLLSSLLPPLLLLLLARGASADYQLVSIFPGDATCGGSALETSAEYLGCTAATDGSPISYSVACINATAFRADYFNGVSCGGGAIHSAVSSWPAGCVAGAGGGPSTRSGCTHGSYTPPAGAINIYSFAPPNVCPLQSKRFIAVGSLAKACHANPGGGVIQSFEYACNAANVTGVP